MKSNRMFGILCVLLEKERATARELAEYFEVSVRTIHRDLLDLSSAGFPVVTQQGIGGGVYLLPEFRFSKAALSKQDMDVILTGVRSLARINDSAMIKTLLAKLRHSEGDRLIENDIIIDFTAWNHNSDIVEKIKLIRGAIPSRQLLEMEYYSNSGYCRRTVEPYKLIFKQENWYLFAYCTHKDGFRTFKVSRMTKLRATGDVFALREGYALPPMQSAFANDEGTLVTVRMDKSLEFLAVDFFGAQNLNRVEGDVFVTFKTQSPEWVISTFAGFGGKAEILEPIELRERMKAFLADAQRLYKT